ncbi:hypothetical protein RI367_001722 [Sorochytrium milnesiophthora]
MHIAQLPPTTVRQICSGQVITSVQSAVKELVDNAIDGGAKTIHITLRNYGMSSIMVKDDGVGIPAAEREHMAKRYFTSKIRTFEDISSTTSMGFRGEALNSLAALCQNFSITTKTADEPVATTCVIDRQGDVASTKTAQGDTGTTVTAEKLFHHLPVRRQTAAKDAPGNVKAIQDMLTAYAIGLPHLRFVLRHLPDNPASRGKFDRDWIQPATKTDMDSVRLLFGNPLTKHLQRLTVCGADYCDEQGELDEDDNELRLRDVAFDVICPTRGCDAAEVCKPGLQFFYINGRPINPIKALAKVIKAKFHEHFTIRQQMTPFFVLHLRLSPSHYDVNLDPGKETAAVQGLDRIEDVLRRFLDTQWQTVAAPEPVPVAEAPQSPTRVLDDQAAAGSQLLTPSSSLSTSLASSSRPVEAGAPTPSTPQRPAKRTQEFATPSSAQKRPHLLSSLQDPASLSPVPMRSVGAVGGQLTPVRRVMLRPEVLQHPTGSCRQSRIPAEDEDLLQMIEEHLQEDELSETTPTKLTANAPTVTTRRKARNAFAKLMSSAVKTSLSQRKLPAFKQLRLTPTSIRPSRSTQIRLDDNDDDGDDGDDFATPITKLLPRISRVSGAPPAPSDAVAFSLTRCRQAYPAVRRQTKADPQRADSQFAGRLDKLRIAGVHQGSVVVVDVQQDLGEDWNAVLALQMAGEGTAYHLPRQIVDSRFVCNGLEAWLRYDSMQAEQYLAVSAVCSVLLVAKDVDSPSAMTPDVIGSIVSAAIRQTHSSPMLPEVQDHLNAEAVHDATQYVAQHERQLNDQRFQRQLFHEAVQLSADMRHGLLRTIVGITILLTCTFGYDHGIVNVDTNDDVERLQTA